MEPTEPTEAAVADVTTEDKPISTMASGNSDIKLPETEADLVEGEQKEETTETPPYAPNFKYRVGGEDKEIAEWARGAITDSESNQMIREFFEKADGLDMVKDHRDKLQGKLADSDKQIAEFSQSLNTLGDYVQKGHFEDFFDALKIRENDIIQWAAKRLQYHQADPQVRAQMDAERNNRLQSRELEHQAQTAQTQTEQAGVQLRSEMLDWELSKPDVQSYAQHFDAQHGQGSFRNEVIKRGASEFQLNQVDKKPGELIQDIMRFFPTQQPQQGMAPQTPAQGTSPQAPPAPVAQQAQPQAPERPPVIPAVKDAGASPVKGSRPKSLDDLRKRHAELQANEA